MTMTMKMDQPHTQKFNKGSLLILNEAQQENLETEEMQSEGQRHTICNSLHLKQAGPGVGRTKSFSVVVMNSVRSDVRAGATTNEGSAASTKNKFNNDMLSLSNFLSERNKVRRQGENSASSI